MHMPVLKALGRQVVIKSEATRSYLIRLLPNTHKKQHTQKNNGCIKVCSYYSSLEALIL